MQCAHSGRALKSCFVTALRRYALFGLLVAAQIVIVVVAPSHGSTNGSQTVGGQFTGGAPSVAASQPPVQATVPQAGGPPAGGPSAGPAAAGPGSSAGLSRAAQQQAARSGTETPATGGGSTSSKPFCITGLVEHPPCVATWTGTNNGGATSMGVTGSTIKVIMYRPKDNPAVDTILRGTGTYTDPTTERDMFLTVTDWINKHVQLYGRKIEPIYVQGTCDIAPPKDSCFRPEADRLAAQYHPFALFYDNDTAEYGFMDELSRKGVVNWGGWGFSDTFDDSLRPYHYDVFMGGDVQAEFAGAWYCRRLANHKAIYAGDASLRSQVRKVVVVHPDSPVVTSAAQHLEKIIAGCAGSNAVIDGPYASDTSTAAQQAATNTSKYKAAHVTTVLWMSDPIAPAYGTHAQAAQNWYPEQVLAGGGLVDYDALAQTYNAGEWAHAFGPSDLGASANVDNTDAGHIWKAEGRSGHANPNVALLTEYELALTEGLVAAGPKLTPLSYEYGLLNAPGYDSWAAWHNPQLVYVKWGRGDYTAISDVREVYYSPRTKSPVNGRSGSYIALNGGRRYQLNQIPSGDPKLPSGV
jgi:hypothetical protein